MTQRKRPISRLSSHTQKEKRPHTRAGGKPSRAAKNKSSDDKSIWLWGLHAVAAALANPDRQCQQLLLTENAAKSLKGMANVPNKHSARAEGMNAKTITAMLPAGAVHQGVAMLTRPLPEPDLAQVCTLAPGAAATIPATVLMLDQVTDPHNVGAILRSAWVFGARAVIITARQSPPASGIMAKSASGALEHMPLVRATNLARAIETLQSLGYLCLGLDEVAPAALSETATGPATALVLGGEGKGLRRLTRERCDILASLPAAGDFASLNVSNAAAVALYDLSQRHTPPNGGKQPI